MRTYIVTVLIAAIIAFLTVVLWGAIGHRLNGFIVSLVLAGILLLAGFGLAAWRGRWAGYRGATLRGWWAMVFVALLMLIAPPLLDKDVVAEALGEHGTWWLGSKAETAPAFVGNGMHGIAQLLGYGGPSAEVDASSLAAEPERGEGSGEESGQPAVIAEPAVVAEGSGADPAGAQAVPDPQEVPSGPEPTIVPATNEPAAEPIAEPPVVEPPVVEPPVVELPGSAEPTTGQEAGTLPAEPTPVAPVSAEPTPPAAEPTPTMPAEPEAAPVPVSPVPEPPVVTPPPLEPVVVAPIHLATNGDAPLVPQMEAVVVSGSTVWPSSSTPHPLAASLDSSSFQALQAGICALRTVDRLRVAHDWIALNITPVAAAPQSAAVPTPEQRAAWASGAFISREAGSAGFAALFSELTCDAGAVVVGGGDVAFHRGIGPAAYWNAVQLDGNWLIVDAHQAAGCAPLPECSQPYSSAFFLAPPRATVRTRIPSQPSFGPYGGDVDITALLSGPRLGPEFFAAGLALQRVSSEGHFEVTVANPAGYIVRVALWDSSAAMSVTCRRSDVSGQTTFVCPTAGPAGGRVRLLGQAADGWAWVELAAWETL